MYCSSLCLGIFVFPVAIKDSLFFPPDKILKSVTYSHSSLEFHAPENAGVIYTPI